MEQKRKKILTLSITIIVLSSSLIKIYYDNKRIEGYGVYSVGTIENVEGIKGSASALVSFPFRDKIIRVKVNAYDIRNRDIGKKIYVRFLPNNPETGGLELITNKAVVNLNVPYNGWSSLEDALKE